MVKTSNRYQALVERIFFDHYKKNISEFEFDRSELIEAAQKLDIKLPKNLGDVIYSIRYRASLPETIQKTAHGGLEWVIEGAGRARYCFKLLKVNRIVPNADLIDIKVPDSTPEIIAAYALSDEQALLAKVRYNRLIDVFLGITTYSLQNHLRTTVKGIGQIEIDEVYIGIDRAGRQYVIPVQAKGGSDQLAVVQTKQDIACCAEKFPDLICRPVSTQFIEDDLIAIFELSLQDEEIRIVEEKHYRLVPHEQITSADLKEYRKR